MAPKFSLLFIFLLNISYNVIEGIVNGELSLSQNGQLGAALINTKDEDGHLLQCSGALISNRHVLTNRVCCPR